MVVSQGDQYDSQPIPIHGLSQDGVWRCEPSYHSVEECGGENYTHGWRFCILEYRECLHRSLGLYRTLPTLCDSLWDATPTLVSTREVHWYQQLSYNWSREVIRPFHSTPIHHPSCGLDSQSYKHHTHYTYFTYNTIHYTPLKGRRHGRKPTHLNGIGS